MDERHKAEQALREKEAKSAYLRSLPDLIKKQERLIRENDEKILYFSNAPSHPAGNSFYKQKKEHHEAQRLELIAKLEKLNADLVVELAKG